MAVNPNEYQLVFQERAKDRMGEAEQWRLAQTVRSSNGERGHSPGPTLALRRLMRSLVPTRTEERTRPTGPTVSRPAQ